jgi:photosystem II stability/assembly factor-like uncharacterized protein
MKKFTIFNLALTILLIAQFILNTENCMCQSGWVNQPLPVYANSYDMKFFDANTGIISLETPALLRTTNGGQNWAVIKIVRIFQMELIDNMALYCWARTTTGYDQIYRTFDRGLTWDSVSITSESYQGLSFINRDTGWVSGFNGSYFGVWKTTNGGITLQVQSTTFGMGKIFFLKYKINGEYYGWVSHYNSMYKTTNSGVNWFLVGPAGNLTQLNMIDTGIGWASNGSVNILKTTNGGLNWVNLPMPSGNGIVLSNIDRFKIINYNKVYGVGGTRYFGNGIYKGIVWITTNGGINWGFQQPDTSIPNGKYEVIDFIDSLKGWCDYIHTTDGGGPITKIIAESTIISKQYYLKQNYPNPFNPQTTIEFSLIKNSHVSFKIYDITGKEVLKIYNNEALNTGNYKVILDFSKVNLSSGIYFCKLEVNDLKNNQVFVETKKMMMIK